MDAYLSCQSKAKPLLRLGLVCFCSVWLSACGGGSTSPTSPEPSFPNELSFRERVELSKAEVMTWQAEKVAQVKALDCQISSSDPCQDVTVHFDEGHFQANNTREEQTILVIDDAGLEFPATVRYRSRVLGAYRLDTTIKSFETYSPSIVLPQYLRDLLQQLDSLTFSNNQQDYPALVSASWLNELGQAVEDQVPNTVTRYGAFHGDLIFLYLLEHNPQARFVVLQTPPFFEAFQTSFCALDADRLRQQVAQVSSQFSQSVLDSHSVRYVNFSGGYDLASITRTWQRLCDAPLPNQSELSELLKTLTPFYQTLFQSDKRLGIQASGINMSVETHPLDTTTEFANHRVRVGWFTAQESNLPEDGVIGEIAPPELVANLHNSRGWIDYFPNFGVQPIRPWVPNNSPVMEIELHGLGVYPISSFQPSWAAPVALSHAVYLQQSRFAEAEWNSTLIEQLQQALTPSGCTFHLEDQGRCKLQDPMRYQQHEVFRLNVWDNSHPWSL